MGLTSPIWMRRLRSGGLLNSFPGSVAAYSLRNLSSGTGNVVRVRRSSDNAEQDFTATQITNGALVAWVGANNGMVTTWYDQSGNDRHQTQGTAGLQGRIVSSGVLETDGGKPCIRTSLADTAGFHMGYTDTNELDAFRTGAQSSFCVAKLEQRYGFWQAIWCPSTTSGTKNGGIAQQYLSNATNVFGCHNTNVVDTRPAPITVANELNRYLFTMIRNSAGTAGNGATVYQYAKNTTDSQSASGVQTWTSETAGTGRLVIGKQWDVASDATVASWYGAIQEVVLYASDLSANKTAIEANINSYYQVF